MRSRRPTPGLPRHRAPAVWLLAALVLCVGSGASVATAVARSHQFDEIQVQRLARQREQVARQFEDAVNEAGDVMVAAASYVAASEDVSPDEWQRYADSLQLTERVPGSGGIGVVVPVAWADRFDAVAERQRVVPEAGLRTNEVDHELAMVVNTSADPHYVGLDVAIDAERRATLDRARDTGELAFTTPVHKLTDTDKPAAERPWTYVMYAPIYRTGTPPATVEERRRQHVGWISASMVVNSLVERSSGAGMDVALLAGDRLVADHVIGSTTSFDALVGDRSVTTTTVRAGGQTFLLAMAPVGAAENDSGAGVVLGAGLLVTFAIACLLVQMGLQRNRLRLQVDDAVAELEAANERLARQALHDSLTRLPNRALFEDRLAHAIERSRRTGEQHLVLFLDVDRFKATNDRYGHAAGDQVLRTIAARLATTLRSSDTAARLGGDEFVVLCEHVGNPIEARQLAERIEAAVNGPTTVDGVEIEIATSVGYTMNAPGDRLPEVLAAADAAMYRAKARRRSEVGSETVTEVGADDALTRG